MMPRWVNLNDQERNVYHATYSFLKGRLEEHAAIEWALRLRPNDTINRFALLDLLDGTDGKGIGEPWRSAWRLIEEGWSKPPIDERNPNEYFIEERLRGGERSGAIIARIVELVEPRLKVEPFPAYHRSKNLKKRPKQVGELLSIGLTSRKMFDPAILGLDGIADAHFLNPLASALDFAVTNGLDIARHIGWDGEPPLYQLGYLYRVYFVPPPYTQGGHEPDEFHRGIAPSTKLLNAVVSRLVEVDISSAQEFIRRWKLTRSPVHIRLWASLSRDPRTTPADEVGTFLLSLTDELFWGVNDYPEIAELRAVRFSEHAPHVQTALTARIRKKPPREHWPKEAGAGEIKGYQVYWAVREIKRIDVAGASMPKRDKTWLDKKIHEFPDLAKMRQVDHGFLGIPRGWWRQPTSDMKYYSLNREERLKALEADLSSKDIRSIDDPYRQASDWINKGNLGLLLTDFESVPDGGNSFPEVWKSFCWAHSPLGRNGADDNLPAECTRVLVLLAKLSEATIRKAIEGISHWFSAWKKQIVDLRGGVGVWFKVWPIAVEATNEKEASKKQDDFEAAFGPEKDPQGIEKMEPHASPAGMLMDVFLAACPGLGEDRGPFDIDMTPGKMRDAIMAATGTAKLVALYRMIEHLNYFLAADPEWVNENLISILLDENPEFIRLWPGVARQTHFTKVLELIGSQMAERAIDPRLDRETRRSLVFSLVIECLYSFLEERAPAVPYARILQMLQVP